MQLPIRSLQFSSRLVCTQLSCLPDVLQMTPFERIPIADASGIEFAVDIHPTQGFYLLICAFVFLRSIRVMFKTPTSTNDTE